MQCFIAMQGASVSISAALASPADVCCLPIRQVIPSEGGKVLVLTGPHTREVGRVMRKAKGAAAVQLLSDHSVLKVFYEDISEYLGQDHD